MSGNIKRTDSTRVPTVICLMEELMTKRNTGSQLESPPRGNTIAQQMREEQRESLSQSVFHQSHMLMMMTIVFVLNEVDVL